MNRNYSQTPGKKQSKRRLSDFPDRVKLYEMNSRYAKAKSETKTTQKIRALCEEIRRARMNESRAKYKLPSAVRDAQ
ncbi:MAG: hypothetical protein M3367_17150 [Acidobacteriota bacterium]|nr:hypothetical protein [Acidobacteriota bacterium]